MKTLLETFPQEVLGDINIQINNPATIMNEIITQTKDKKDVTVMIYTDYYNYSTVVEIINKNWKKEYYHYLKENNINMEIITPKEIAVFQEKKKLQLKDGK